MKTYGILPESTPSGIIYTGEDESAKQKRFEGTDDEITYTYQGKKYTLNFLRGEYERIKVPENNVEVGSSGYSVKNKSELKLPNGVKYGLTYSETNIATGEKEYYLDYLYYKHVCLLYFSVLRH